MMEMEAPIFVAGKTGKAVRKGLMQLSLSLLFAHSEMIHTPVRGLEGAGQRGGLPSTTSELAVFGNLAEAMANACLHSLTTKSALPSL